MKTALGISAFIARCSLPLWVRWHSSTKTNTSPTVGLGCASSSLMKASKSSTSLRPNLWTSEQSRRGLAWPSWLIRSRPLLVRLMASPALGEDALDLFVQLVAVGDDGDAGVRVVLQNPLGEQHHDDALAAALRVPDDAALLLAHVRLRGLDAEILVRARQLLHAAVEEHEVVHQLDQPVLRAHLEQILVELEAAVVRLVFLPLQEVLLRRADGAVLQPLGVVAGEDELHRAEEPLVELRLLVGEASAGCRRRW